jgi:hypothetical protein
MVSILRSHGYSAEIAIAKSIVDKSRMIGLPSVVVVCVLCSARVPLGWLFCLV